MQADQFLLGTITAMQVVDPKQTGLAIDCGTQIECIILFLV